MEETKKKKVFVESGRKGGKRLLRKRGKAHFAKIAGMRKHFGGGRPKKAKS